MPWCQRSPMDLRSEFIAMYLRRTASISEICRNFGISRKTGYKWIDRYQRLGWPEWLVDQSRRPKHSPDKVPDDIAAKIVEERRLHPTWGPKKLLVVLSGRKTSIDWPSPSTVNRILKSHGLVQPRRRQQRPGHVCQPLSSILAPNDVWCADFKGWFLTRDGNRCNPLTLTDAFSRYLLACKGLGSPSLHPTWKVFAHAFREYGMPKVIRTDNGAPFASTALARLSHLSIWFIQLGIVPELIQPSHPEQNGRHERMHRTLKAEATKPPCSNMASQQRRFDLFRQEFNYERPHEALGQRTPGSLYRPSTVKYADSIPIYDYPPGIECRRADLSGTIRWKGAEIRLTKVLAGQHVGLQSVEGGWDVFYRFVRLGRIGERSLRLERPARRKCKV